MLKVDILTGSLYKGTVKIPSYVMQYPKVMTFLESKARNSVETAETYSECIGRLEKYLTSTYDKRFNIETILTALQNGEINVYKFLDEFISHMMAKTSWTTNTIQLTVRGLRSYFAYYDID